MLKEREDPNQVIFFFFFYYTQLVRTWKKANSELRITRKSYTFIKLAGCGYLNLVKAHSQHLPTDQTTALN